MKKLLASAAWLAVIVFTGSSAFAAGPISFNSPAFNRSKANEPRTHVKTLMLDMDAGLQANLNALRAAISRAEQDKSAVRIEFQSLVRVYLSDYQATKVTDYPNGDFYFLIGTLGNSWSKSDYADFYSTAVRLSVNGFRPIINPAAYASDVREAVQNPDTTGIIWDSHASTDGAVYDSHKQPLAEDIFTKDTSPRLRYVLFANCYGTASKDYYKLSETQAAAYGWDGEATSPMLFGYLQSDSFISHLEAALGVSLSKKSGADIY